MTAIMDFFRGLWTTFVDFILSIFDYFLRLIIWLLDFFLDFLITIIPQQWIDRFNDIDWSLLTNTYEIFGYLIPIDILFIIGTYTFSAIVIIRLVRWGIGLIPTVEG